MPAGTPPESAKASLVLVHEHLLFRLLLERSLSKEFRLSCFSGAEDALAFIQTTSSLDVLVTGLKTDFSPLGGCNIARGARQRFPNALIYVFSSGLPSDDYRVNLLRTMVDIKILSTPLNALFLRRKIRSALQGKASAT